MSEYVTSSKIINFSFFRIHFEYILRNSMLFERFYVFKILRHKETYKKTNTGVWNKQKRLNDLFLE